MKGAQRAPLAGAPDGSPVRPRGAGTARVGLAALVLVSSALAFTLWRRVERQESELVALRARQAAAEQTVSSALSRSRVPLIVRTGATGAEPEVVSDAPTQQTSPPNEPDPEPEAPATEQERAAVRAARVQAAVERFENQPPSGHEARRTRALEGALGARLEGQDSSVRYERISCRGAACSLPVSFPSNADVSAFNRLVKEAARSLPESEGTPLVSLLTRPENGQDVGRYFFDWREPRAKDPALP